MRVTPFVVGGHRLCKLAFLDNEESEVPYTMKVIRVVDDMLRS